MRTKELKLNQLKQIAKIWNLEVKGDKRKKQTWIDAVEAKRQEMSQPEVKEEEIKAVEVKEAIQAQAGNATEAIRQLAPANNNYIPIHLYRQALPQLTREQQDQELYKLQREDAIDLGTIVECCWYTNEQLEAGIPLPGRKEKGLQQHYFYIKVYAV